MKPVDISPADIETVRRVLLEHVPGLEVWAFGSRVSWTARETSDLDIALMTTEPLDVMRLAEMREAFVQSDLPFRVDIVDWSPTSKAFQSIIRQNCVVVQEKTTELNVEDKWRKVQLGSVAEIVGGSTPSTKVPQYFNGDVPWLTPKDLANAHARYIFRGKRNLSQEGLDSCSAKLLPRGAVLLSTRAPVGYVAIAGTEIATNQGFHSLLFGNEVCSEFAYYWLKGNTEELERHASGSTFQEISGSALKDICIPLPPIPDQEAIAHILGTLDDKIELNRQMNRTLEEMARALFKSWFVNFDPVRAKMDGRWSPGESLPGLPAHLYDLFPDYFVPSELGEIPEGWQIKALRELILLAYGKALRADDRQEGTIPVYGSNGQIGWHNKKLVTGPGIIVGRKGNPGTVTWAHGDFFAIDTSFYVVPIDPALDLSFLYYALADQDLPSIAADSAVPGLNRNLAYMNIQLVPDQILVDKFGNYINGIFEHRYRLEEESRSLAALRDALLPKLISGELDTF